ncbi:MAG: hypothetical protein NTV70_18305 [Acidobacteria bacterium]|nr:hypothetical protein [Acidobacteriota bacterium]
MSTKPVFQRGVNFTAERPDVYGTPGAIKQLERLPGYGINAISLVPYGFTRAGTPMVRLPGPGSWERDEGLIELGQRAHELGMFVLLKPQIWVGGGAGSFPGSLDFPVAADREAWFASYAMFVDHYAALATRMKADLYCVGTEFVKLSAHETQWRSLIARARQKTSAPLTYAATQGPEFETLAFWDALDYIGLNNYYPLPDTLDASGIVAKVAVVQKKYRKPVVLTEAGYASLEAPHKAPWDETPRKVSLEDQSRCYEAIFQAFYKQPWFMGMYWWKVGTNGYGGPTDGSHTPWGKPAMEVVKKWYRSGGR